jgi:hypothetical protein
MDLKTAIKEFSSFLKEHRVEGDGEYTHTSFGPPWGKYYIAGEDLVKFLELYNNVVGLLNLHITEKPKKVGPLIFDLDFRFDMEHKTRQYKQTHIKKILEKVNMVLEKYFVLNGIDEFDAFVFEKEVPTYDQKRNIYKDGIHIIYPNIDVNFQMRYLIFDEVKRITTEEKTLSDIHSLNDEDDIFDSSIIMRTGWMMYGSCKHQGNPYYLTHVYDKNLNDKQLNIYEKVNLASLLSLQARKDENETKVKDNQELQDKLKYIDGKYIGKKKQKSNSVIVSSSNLDEINSMKAQIEGNKNENVDLNVVRKLVELLSVDRASNYHSWISVAWALHNISPELFNEFVEFSKKASNGTYTYSECLKIWNKAKDSGLSIASLHYWAKQDNPQQYTSIKS